MWFDIIAKKFMVCKHFCNGITYHAARYDSMSYQMIWFYVLLNGMDAGIERKKEIYGSNY